MDVSAPRPSQSPATPTTSDQIAVRPAPLTAEVPKTSPPAQSAAATQKTKPDVQREAAKPRSGAPVGVITVAVLAMMILSAAAVIVYATSQTS